MSARVCMCCGESLSKKTVVYPRNPNICPSCSSLLDGMEDTRISEPRRQVTAQAVNPPGKKPTLDRKAA